MFIFNNILINLITETMSVVCYRMPAYTVNHITVQLPIFL